MSIFDKFNRGLGKSRKKMAGAIDDMLESFDTFEEDLFVELEEILVMGDVGVETAAKIVAELQDRVKRDKLKSTKQVKGEIKKIVAEMLAGGEDMGLITQPSVILMLGVNGAGKTTTIGKMAAMYKAQGKQVLLGAADTFRAAAIDQLQVWADRAGVDMIRQAEGSDPAAVVFDTIQAGKARYTDIIICDTAGRLHNKKNLMEELRKIYRIIDRELPYSDREILLVLDATTGQNAVSQAREFLQVADLTGIVLTKLDGTARGGVVLTIKNELGVPVKFIGLGEGIDDLQPFDPDLFAQSLFDEIPDNYKKIDKEVLPVYEKPLEIDTGDAAAAGAAAAAAEQELREAFEEVAEALGLGEEGGYDAVPDASDEHAVHAEGEHPAGAPGAVPDGDGLHPQPEAAEEAAEEAPVDQGEGEAEPDAKSDAGQGTQIDDIYGSVGKFYF